MLQMLKMLKESAQGYKVLKGLGEAGKGALNSVKNPLHGFNTMMNDVMMSPVSFLKGMFKGGTLPGTLKGMNKEYAAILERDGQEAATKWAREQGAKMDPFGMGPVSTLAKHAGAAVGLGSRAVLTPTVGLALKGADVVGGAVFRDLALGLPHDIANAGRGITGALSFGRDVVSEHPGAFFMGAAGIASVSAFAGAVGSQYDPKLMGTDIENPYVTPGMENDMRFRGRPIESNEDAMHQDQYNDANPRVNSARLLRNTRKYGYVDNNGASGDLVFALHNMR